MGKYKEHREHRPKRKVWDQDPLSGHGFEPSSFLDLSSVPPNVVDAEVLWFDAGKGFGFVKLSDGTEAYLHIRVLEAAGGHDLSDGTHLKVTVEEGPRGRQIGNVVEIGDQISKNPTGDEFAEHGRAETNPHLEIEGTVKWYNPEKGFGFIAPDNGENDVFVHATALTRSGLSVLEDGQKVVFQSAPGKKGMEDRSIRPG